MDKAKHARLRSHKLNAAQLHVLSNICDFLHSVHLVQEVLSAEKTPTLLMVIPTFENLVELLQLLRESLPKIAHSIIASIQKLTKYMLKACKTHIYLLAMSA